MQPPTLNDIYAARERIAPHVPRTPLMQHPLLEAETGLDIWVKHENHNPTGAFKVRGGLNLLGQLADSPAPPAGVASATRGNHGQSLAFAARRHRLACTIVVPHGNSRSKNAAMRAYGAELIEHGRDFDEARAHAHEVARERGLAFVGPFDRPLVARHHAPLCSQQGRRGDDTLPRY